MDSIVEKTQHVDVSSERKRPAQEPLTMQLQTKSISPKRQRQVDVATSAAVATKEKESEKSPNSNSLGKAKEGTATKSATTDKEDSTQAPKKNLTTKGTKAKNNVAPNKRAPPANNATGNKGPVNASTFAAPQRKVAPPPQPQPLAVVTNKKGTAEKTALGSNRLPGSGLPQVQQQVLAGLPPNNHPHGQPGVAGYGQQQHQFPPSLAYFPGPPPPMNNMPAYFPNHHPTYYHPQHHAIPHHQQQGGPPHPMFLSAGPPLPPHFPPPPPPATTEAFAHTQPAGVQAHNLPPVPPPLNLPPPAHSFQTRPLSLHTIIGAPLAAGGAPRIGAPMALPPPPAGAAAAAAAAGGIAEKEGSSEEMPYSPLSKALNAMNPRKSKATLMARQKGEAVPWSDTPMSLAARTVFAETNDLEALLAVKANNKTHAAAQFLESLLNKPSLSSIRDRLLERWIQSDEDIATNAKIVKNIRSFIAHHHCHGHKRPDHVQNALDAVAVAAVFENRTDPPEDIRTQLIIPVAKRLGMRYKTLASCQERAQKLLQGTKDKEDDNNNTNGETKVLFQPVEKKIRSDYVREIAAKAVYDWSHSEECGTRIIKTRRRDVKVTNPHTGQEERHPTRTYIDNDETSNMALRYEAFRKSRHFAKFKEEYPDKDFCKSIFMELVCKCIRARERGSDEK